MRLRMLDVKGTATLVAMMEQGPVELARLGLDWAPGSVEQWLALSDAQRSELGARCHAAEPLDSDGAGILPPLSRPEKILCIGLNYADHAAESGMERPSEPVVFAKLANTLIGPEAPIQLPQVSHKVDYEAELVVVIGKEAKGISVNEARTFVGGYTCGHDVSARDWQLHKPGGQWLLGKTFDSFAPLGPDFVSADELTDPMNRSIQLKLNGQVMQDSHTSQLIFSIDELVSYLSQVMTLRPGDLIFTGTPAGVGGARKPPVYLQDGDRVEVIIDGIGTLSNPVVRGG